MRSSDQNLEFADTRENASLWLWGLNTTRTPNYFDNADEKENFRLET